MEYTHWTWDDRLEELDEHRAHVLAQGGPAAVEKQHQRGKLTARERIERFLDPGTFLEIMPFARHRETAFGMDKKDIPADGVIIGYGEVDGRTVCVWAQDFTALGGTMAEMHGQKVSDLVIKYAAEMRVPQIGIQDSGGARLQEGSEAGELGYSRSMNAIIRASGSIPQLSLIMGPCGGGQGYLPALTDFIIMVKGKSHLYIGGPDAVKKALGQDATVEELGGSRMHSTITGIADMEVADDEECLERGRRILSYLPSAYGSPLPIVEPTDSPDRKCEKLYDIVPADHSKPYDMRAMIKEIVDHGDFLELKKQYSPNSIIGFARFNGIPVGIQANQPLVIGGALNVASAAKFARFIRFCDCFGIPLISLADNPAYMPGVDQEQRGIVKEGSKHLHAFAESTIPKISVHVRKAYSGGCATMTSKPMGADIVFAWPTAVSISLQPEAAINVFYPANKYSEEERSQAVLRYYEKYVNPWYLAGRGYVDDVIRPEETRIKIIQALKRVMGKRATVLPKKHSNIFL
jgi:acetyl-CoA carboxylase carboxyltransferase component